MFASPQFKELAVDKQADIPRHIIDINCEPSFIE